MLTQEIAALKAELEDRFRLPNESPRSAIKTASKARLFLSNQAMQAS